MALINVSEFTFETDTNDSNGQSITVTGNVSVAGGVGIFNDTEGVANLSQTITADTDIGDNADFVMTLSGFRLSSAGLLYLVVFGDIGAGTGFLVMVDGENGYFQIVFYNSGVPDGYDVWETSGFLSAHTYVLTRTNKVYSLTSDGVPCVKEKASLDGVVLPSFVGQQYILGGFEAAGLIAYIENVKFEADRIPATVTLTYNGNGNTTGTAPTGGTFDSNATVTVSAIGDLARTNCNFLEWNTAADGSGTGYDPAETFVITANTTLYAIWRRHFRVNDVVKNNYETYWCIVEHDASTVTEPGVGVSWETYWGKGVSLPSHNLTTDIQGGDSTSDEYFHLTEEKYNQVQANNHNDLSGLQGGDSTSSEYYHIMAPEEVGEFIVSDRNGDIEPNLANDDCTSLSTWTGYTSAMSIVENGIKIKPDGTSIAWATPGNSQPEVIPVELTVEFKTSFVTLPPYSEIENDQYIAIGANCGPGYEDTKSGGFYFCSDGLYSHAGTRISDIVMTETTWRVELSRSTNLASLYQDGVLLLTEEVNSSGPEIAGLVVIATGTMVEAYVHPNVKVGEGLGTFFGEPVWTKKTLSETEALISHNNISNIQGGDSTSSEYYHLTEDEYDQVQANDHNVLNNIQGGQVGESGVTANLIDDNCDSFTGWTETGDVWSISSGNFHFTLNDSTDNGTVSKTVSPTATVTLELLTQFSSLGGWYEGSPDCHLIINIPTSDSSVSIRFSNDGIYTGTYTKFCNVSLTETTWRFQYNGTTHNLEIFKDGVSQGTATVVYGAASTTFSLDGAVGAATGSASGDIKSIKFGDGLGEFTNPIPAEYYHLTSTQHAGVVDFLTAQVFS